MTSQSTLADIAVAHPAATRVFHRHGLDFCCGGRRPLAEVCAAQGLDPAALLRAIDAEEQTPSDLTRWDREPLSALITFIVDTYHRRLRASVPDLIRMAEKVETSHRDKPTCPHGLAAQLKTMHAAVLEHLEKEERVLFPLILAGHGRAAIGPVQVMEMEHDDHGRNLAMVRQLTNNLQAPPEACATWRALYLGLLQLEAELMVHIHLENNVLFRRALAA
jgi:regulator of cell morphogenesis and NO signaling